eukprot:CAMPEP_0116036280 /NCGR_PEP_ID=MMETSP0321-20121206/21066_1 /TAXON_ID=163516 /ORGANISM="Leptocylindrus danicus var. danicus, Strain B650" /LENGTH=41 /DNA_ID= /DNA_START= /DNA_END= /DNA_ORIENTATION=
MAQVQEDDQIDSQDQLPDGADDYSEEYRVGETYKIEFKHQV